MKRFFSIMIVIFTLLSLMACNNINNQLPSGEKNEPHPNAVTYDEVFQKIQDTQRKRVQIDYLINKNSRNDFFVNEDIALEVEKEDFMYEAPTASDTTAAADYETDDGASKDSSQTNVQVSGIDEADIVKNDGKYIYSYSNSSELCIYEVNGAEVKKVSQIPITYEEKTQDGYSGFYVQGMYVYGNRLALVGECYEYSKSKDMYCSVVDIYDISDRSAPQKMVRLGQDGMLNSTRLSEKYVYMISTYTVYEKNMEQENPETFIPSLYYDTTEELIAADKVIMSEDFSSIKYSVVSVYDIENGTRFDELSVLGGGTHVYMNHDRLYITESKYKTTVSESYQSSVYSVVDYTRGNVTEIIKFDISDHKISYEATCTVEGRLLNQFSMDEHNSYLRVVTTEDSVSYSIYEDKVFGFVNEKVNERKSGNSLYIYDASLNLVGSVTDLAENEIVYSVRFDGDIGYFVTFRTTDPLFAVDLSDPTAPKVLSALKIPGFSEYLHVYGEGLLFGLGMDADENTGWTSCMKLTMFDTSNKADVTEKHTLLLEDVFWSEARQNHKALLISPQKNIIGFPVEKGYMVYGYDAENGFFERAFIEYSNYGYNSRGIYIGDYMYILGNNTITVLDMVNFTCVGEFQF